MTATQSDKADLSRSRSGTIRSAGVLTVIVALGGCTSSSTPTPEAAAKPAGVPSVVAAQLVGKWGLAAYREEKDIARTEVEAKAACSNPYVIGQGTAGVIMHLADQAQPTELAIKTIDGRTFIGPPSEPAGAPRDREITSFTPDLFVTKWVDPSAANRYGVMIYARCSATA